MAKRVASVEIQAKADLKGFEDASKALRDLARAVGPTDAAIEKARQEIIEFSSASKRTEASIKSQLDAFQKLRQQAQIGGAVYGQLGKDIDKLKQIASGSTGALDKLSLAVGNIGRSATSRSVWQQQAKELAAFNRQAGETGKALGQLANSFGLRFEKASSALQEASREIEALKRNASNIGGLMQGPAKGGGVFEVGRKGLSDIQKFADLVRGLKAQAETATGKVARLSEGMFALGATGVAVGQVTNALGGVSGAIERVSSFGANLSGLFAQMGANTPSWSGPMKAALNQIALLLNQPANGIANWAQSLAGAQAKLSALNAPLEAFNTALGAIGPEGAAAAGVVAVAFAGLQDAISRAFKAGEADASKALQGITDDTQRLLLKLEQLSEAFRGAASMNELRGLLSGAQGRFNETPAGTDASRRAANSIASAEARIKAEGLAQAEVLENARQRYRGTAESVDALSERLAYLQSAMKLVDQSTAEGNAEFAAFASEATQLKRQIDQLSNSYRTVADAIRDAAQAQGEYANQSTVANYFNRAAVRRQEEIATAAREQLARPQTPLLPSAGQTSFAGEYGPGGIGGGARMGTGAKEFVNIISTEQVGAGVTAIYRGLERTQMEADATAAALERGFNRAGAAINRAEEEIDQLQKELNDTLQDGKRLGEALAGMQVASPNSINILRARREQIEKERNSVDLLSADYKRLSRELATVDKQIERTQPGGMRGKVGFIAQGIGAAASAGIFGGPEGLLGGLGGGAIGALLGGPAGFAAGSFTGSSIGAYAGMGRQSLGQFTTYAADIQKQEIALKGITKTTDEYQRALAAAAGVTRDFNVPQLEATRGITQLSAAVVGAGGKVADSEVVFRNVTAAIKASGGTSEDVQGALTALGQIFSKGKVSAEELQGQLGERLPGAVTMFAKATGRTLPQLQKDLEQGTVGLADLMKFVVSDQGLGQFEQRALAVSKSAAEAGARLTTAFNDTKRAIGEALLPLGAQIQDSLGQALKSATPALVDLAKGLAGFVKFLVENGPVIAGLAKFALQMGAVTLAIKAFTALQPAIIATFASFQLGGAKAAAAAALATPRVAALGTALKSLSLIGLITIGIDLVVRGVSDFYKLKGEIEALQNYEPTKVFAGSTRETVSSAINKAKEDLAKFQKQLQELQGSQWKTLIPGAMLFGAGPSDYYTQYKELQVRIARAQKTISSLDPLKFPTEFQIEQDNLRKLQEQLTDFSGSQKGDLDKEALERVRKERERLVIQTADAQRQLDLKVFQYQTELDKRRYELQQQLIDLTKQAEIESLTGVSKEYASRANQLRIQLRDIFRESRETAANEALAGNNLRTAQTYQSAVGGVSTGIVARTGNTGDSTGAHLDLRWGDGRPITKADADKYFLVNGKAPSSFGVTSPYGPRSLFGRSFHSGIDFGTPAGSALSLTGGATMLRNLGNTGAGGYAIEVMTPEGVMKALHLMAGSVMASGGTRAEVRASKVTGTEQLDLQQATALRALSEQTLAERAEKTVQIYVEQNTSAIRERIAAISDENEINRERFRLQMEGYKPEQIEAELEALKTRQQQTKELASAERLLAQYEAELKTTQDPQRQRELRLEIEAQRRIIAELPGYYDQLRASILGAAEAQMAFNDAMRFRQDMNIGEGFKEGIQQYVESIGTMREATAQLAQNGIKGVEDAIFSLVTTGKANFQEFAADILKQTARMIIQQLVLRSIMQAIGALGGGGGSTLDNAVKQATSGFSWMANGGVFAQNGIQPFAMGGIVNKPTLFKFANGGTMSTGVMGEAGPEAIVPLKRGPDGKLGIAGGAGGVTVNVSVDAQGTQVQGNAGQGQALGRAVAAAVQQELVRQKRPGGLLAA